MTYTTNALEYKGHYYRVPASRYCKYNKPNALTSYYVDIIIGINTTL